MTAMPNRPLADIASEHGLSDQEFDLVITLLGREPNLTELGIFSVMWSEHCSYKSSKRWLKTLPTDAPWVICGPGENAGIVDIGDGQAAVFKMESHNHPSFIEPCQGAATGVGGILRDIFTMGARPIANMNALRFGAADHPRTRHLLAGVVAGIGGYGNCIGVPTVGGETNFHPAYNGNILVNAMTVGIADTDKIFYSAASGLGYPVVYVGSKTGRDGIHGATMASAEFDDDSEEKRPTVQVGDPFTEKLLLEACLELMATDAIVGIQDMGAAGLTCSTVEMADKGGVGVELDLDRVPTRESGMTAYEIMLSESQERMLMVLHPGKEALAQSVFEKWELDFAIVGQLTDTERLVLKMDGATVADIPIRPLVDAAPDYDRPYDLAEQPAALSPVDSAPPNDLADALATIMATPDLADKSWIWTQYDYSVMADTIQPPGGDAAVVRVHGTGKALAISTDCTPRYCLADPRQGAAQAVAECWRNLTAVGARPLAITDCLNFGNPERPEIMGQIVGSIQGMGAACRALDFPVVSGNVSLYNETNGKAILPTPAIGGVGMLTDSAKMLKIALAEADQTVLLFGRTTGHLGQSLYLREIEGREEGPPPPVDLDIERRNGDFVRGLADAGHLQACHDLSDGGLIVGLAEMCLAGGVGAEIQAPLDDLPLHAWLFGEDQARYLVAVRSDAASDILAQAARAEVPTALIATTGGEDLTLRGAFTISLERLRQAHECWLPDLMAAPREETKATQ